MVLALIAKEYTRLNMGKLDFFYPLIEGPRDCAELRYSLRSMADLDINEVWIVGYKPSWIKNVRHIPYSTIRYHGTEKALSAAHKEVMVYDSSDADEVVIMSDDIYRVHGGDIGYYLCGMTLIERLQWAIKRERPPYVIKSLKNALRYFPDGVAVYNHAPKRVDRLKALEVHKKYPTTTLPFLTSNLYVNEYHNDHEWVIQENVKMYRKARGGCDRYFSTSDTAAKEKDFINTMERMFPNKSKYERI